MRLMTNINVSTVYLDLNKGTFAPNFQCSYDLDQKVSSRDKRNRFFGIR